MIYLVCFLLSLATLLYLVANDRGMDINPIILSIVVAVGNGGYYALSVSSNLNEAILANNVTYAIGCFAPMLMFLIICNISRINVSTLVQTILYLIQILIYLSVMTSGKLTIFYKTIEYCVGVSGPYLVKTYGPMHSIYIVSLGIYMIASILVVGESLRRKRCRISTSKAKFLLLLFLVSAILYFVERFADISVEMMPVIFTTTNFLVQIVFINISRYSAYGNLSILEKKNSDVAYMVFSNNLLYMSCNDYALELFPELAQWQLEKRIPGSGGRFNTFLRIKFMEYVNSDTKEKGTGEFTFDNKYYRVEFSNLSVKSKMHKGYVIEVALDVAKTQKMISNV